MSNALTIVLVPFVAAAVFNIILFYTRENASSLLAPHFLLACLSALMLASYQVLRVFDVLPGFAPLAYGIAGMCLLIGTILMWRFW